MYRPIYKYVSTRNEIFPTCATLYTLTGSEAEGSVGFGPRINRPANQDLLASEALDSHEGKMRTIRL